MNSPTIIVLTFFVVWALFLLVLMEVIRAKLVLSREFPANGFSPDNANQSPFMQRLARAHANCVEGLPIFGGLMLVAIVTAQTAVTDPLAYVFLAARLAQSLIHLLSVSAMAVTLRFSAFAVQLVIAIFWSYALLQSLLA
ncbi:MAG: MAPEG family protein [Gammaproteobacteria bacterium]|nr:MAPEG family protein [Gammaproteobacteria bacterium]MDH5213369.1 MAPEG family protein [Gammaproteobacteria bacterium]